MVPFVPRVARVVVLLTEGEIVVEELQVALRESICSIPPLNTMQLIFGLGNSELGVDAQALIE